MSYTFTPIYVNEAFSYITYSGEISGRTIRVYTKEEALQDEQETGRLWCFDASKNGLANYLAGTDYNINRYDHENIPHTAIEVKA